MRTEESFQLEGTQFQNRNEVMICFYKLYLLRDFPSSLLPANGFEPGAQTSSKECGLEESCGNRAEGESVLPFPVASFMACGIPVDSLQSELKLKRERAEPWEMGLGGT